MKLFSSLAIFLFLICCPLGARADVLFYNVPGSNIAFVLQGTTKVNPGRTVSFRHPKFGKLIFALQNVQIEKAPSPRSIAEKKLKKAINKKDAVACLEAGSWALHHGLLPQFYKAASAAWKIDPQNSDVVRLVALKRRMDSPLGDSSKEEAKLRQFLGRGDMKVAKSKHFLLMHDTSDKPAPNRKKTRAEERIELLETVYESFLLKFSLEGIEISPPKEYMKVVLFADEKDYLLFSTRLSPSLAKASGFWTIKENISVFYDQSTSDISKILTSVSNSLQRQKKLALRVRASNTKDVVRLANTITLLTEVAKENLDIEVVSHETTHQMAGNTGLLPRDAAIPRWVAEGLATYFESPKEAAWSGIGAVNKERLALYRALERDREHSSIDFIVGDKIFDYAASDGAFLHGYGQSWALTHFLMEKHFTKFMSYYQKLGQLKGEKRPTAEEYEKVFNEVFGEEHAGLEAQWKAYMRKLRTDIELILEDL